MIKIKARSFERIKRAAGGPPSPHSPSSVHSKTDIEELVREIEQERVQRRNTITDLFQQLLEENSMDYETVGKPRSPPRESIILQKGQGCKCSKIGCLKLYCDCFNKGEVCGSECSCVGCHNQPGNQQDIESAKMMANYRHPGYFKGVQAFVPTKRCTCKKSHCIKKYCECHNSGMRCSSNCQCTDCHNRDMLDEGSNQMSYIEIPVKG